jgi:hypothetical protein
VFPLRLIPARQTRKDSELWWVRKIDMGAACGWQPDDPRVHCRRRSKAAIRKRSRDARAGHLSLKLAHVVIHAARPRRATGRNRNSVPTRCLRTSDGRNVTGRRTILLRDIYSCCGQEMMNSFNSSSVKNSSPELGPCRGPCRNTCTYTFHIHLLGR